ncbi:MAG: DUF481 domain-containing protein [Acidiferrobacterales bacterium]|nr:DUF481 domain-containing protein [Acidiferrobacterales bacterium]
MTFSNAVVAQDATGQWSGQGEAGLVKASGNTDSENLNLGLNFQKDGELWNQELKLVALQASNSGENTADSLAADYTLKRNLTERSNVFFNLGYLDDDFDGFTEQLSTAVGYGYKILDTEKLKWETGIGVGYRDTATELMLEDGRRVEGEDVSGATFVLRSDYFHKFTDNTEFVDKFKAEIGSDNSFIENDAALYVSMNERFALKAGILIRHNSDPAPGVKETDTITSMSLVYKFNQ